MQHGIRREKASFFIPFSAQCRHFRSREEERKIGLKMKTSIQYKLLYALFRTIGVNKMLDKKDADFDKLLESCRDKQKKPLKVYQAMLERFAAENIRFFGTSSGAGQALSLCVYIKHESIDVPLPRRLVLQSPGLQVPPSESQKAEMERRKKADVMIPPGFFDAIAPVLATGEEAYLLSPLLYDLTGFPETDIFYGTREVMIAYLKDFQDACKKYGVKLHTHIGKGMMHCWGAMEFVPEAKAIRQEYFSALGRKTQSDRLKRRVSEPGRQAESDALRMQKLAGLTETEVTEIARQIADTFYDYRYHEDDAGLIKYISSREDMFTYMNAIVRAAYKSGLLYTTSDRHEGFLVLSGEGTNSVGFVDGIRMILAEKQALGGFRKMKEFISACFCNGGSIETRMRKSSTGSISRSKRVRWPHSSGKAAAASPRWQSFLSIFMI